MLLLDRKLILKLQYLKKKICDLFTCFFIIPLTNGAYNLNFVFGFHCKSLNNPHNIPSSQHKTLQKIHFKAYNNYTISLHEAT